MKHTLEKHLEHMQIPTLTVKKFASQLEKELMSASSWNKKSNFRDFLWKGGENIMIQHKIITSGIAFGVMAIVIAGGIFLLPNNTKTAYAEQIAQQSYHALSHLSPDKLQDLKQRLPVDPNDLLSEAKNAKDLQTITYDQFVKYTPQIKMRVGMVSGKGEGDQLPPLGTPETMDMHNYKFLQFTDPNGYKVILGIDENNLPVFAFGRGKDGSAFGMVHKVGGKGPETGSVRIEGKDGPPDMKGVQSVMTNDGGNTLFINGKQYTVPAGVPLSDEPPSIKVEGNDVYINGVKATPKQ